MPTYRPADTAPPRPGGSQIHGQSNLPIFLDLSDTENLYRNMTKNIQTLELFYRYISFRNIRFIFRERDNISSYITSPNVHI